MLLAALFAALLLISTAQAEIKWPKSVNSVDGVPIAYEVYGSGKPTLIFIHGWSCDGRYWRAQVEDFSAAQRTIIIDLAGHGHSGLQREQYTMSAFAEDVRAVVENEQAEQVVLIGHSMGGAVSLAAARLIPEQVIGIVGVDTFHDLGQRLSKEEINGWMAPLREDFVGAVGPFVAAMFIGATDAGLRDWIIADMAAAPPQVALSAMDNMLQLAGDEEHLAAVARLNIPVVTINADLWPTNVEGNREHLPKFEATILAGADHFLHMADPIDFNRKLARALAAIQSSADD